MVMSGKASEMLDSLSSRWPGHGLPDDAQMNQFVEGEYMKADEYDHFLYDCADWCFRRYLPRSLGALAPFATFAPLYDMLGMPNRFVQPAARPDVRAAFQAIIDYGKESEEWMKPLMELGREVYAAGYPSFMGGQAHAPFDILADTLRGTRGIIMDMYRQPDKVMRAIEMLIPMNIDIGVRQANQSGRPFVFFALHKGDDMFMSDEQFEKFYWPGLRAVILGLIEEGIVPYLFAEGKYTNRLRIIKDLPRGKALWHFDQTDMDKAKDILGDVCAITGNVPTSLLVTGTPSQVREYCRHLIEYCGKGGGFILTGGASINRGDPDNLRAMTDAVKEYGVYA
jgi:uroporphyrinogen-III decarboxylase